MLGGGGWSATAVVGLVRHKIAHFLCSGHCTSLVTCFDNLGLLCHIIPPLHPYTSSERLCCSLSHRGHALVRGVRQTMAGLSPTPDVVLVSPLTRAIQTAIAMFEGTGVSYTSKLFFCWIKNSAGRVCPVFNRIYCTVMYVCGHPVCYLPDFLSPLEEVCRSGVTD